jgi:peptide methionine sulfoxide reductase MsrA
MEIAILGLGCFWGPEIKFSKLDGVIKTEVGYCGGNSSETTIKKYVLEQLIMLKL